jgi:hypothetical protein
LINKNRFSDDWEKMRIPEQVFETPKLVAAEEKNVILI